MNYMEIRILVKLKKENYDCSEKNQESERRNSNLDGRGRKRRKVEERRKNTGKKYETCKHIQLGG